MSDNADRELYEKICGLLDIESSPGHSFLIVSDGTVGNTRVFCKGELLGLFRKVTVKVDGDAHGYVELGQIIYTG